MSGAGAGYPAPQQFPPPTGEPYRPLGVPARITIGLLGLGILVDAVAIGSDLVSGAAVDATPGGAGPHVGPQASAT